MSIEQRPQTLPEWIMTEDGHRFQLPAKTAKIIAQRGFREVSTVSMEAVRVFNQGQGGDAVGSTYEYKNQHIITSNRNGDSTQDKSSFAVRKEIQVPVVTLINDEGKLIKLLVASQVVLDSQDCPIEDFFRLEDILNPEELTIYKEHHGKGNKIDFKTRMILAQAEQTVKKFHRVLDSG